jgi:hypothetical protein
VQIVLLILSQDDGLVRTVYKVRLQKVSWFSDRAALNISLGDLMLIVLLKSAFRNATTVQDEYVHTNSMSTLINLAPQAVKLSPVTTQRLCSFIETSHKRLLWLDRKVWLHGHAFLHVACSGTICSTLILLSTGVASFWNRQFAWTVAVNLQWQCQLLANVHGANDW